MDVKQAKHDHTDSSSSKALSIEEDRNLYGLPATWNPYSSKDEARDLLPRIDVDAEIVERFWGEIEDVGEGGKSPEGGPAKAAPKPLQFWDSSKLAMERSVGGKKILAKMKEGPNGFLMAEFDGEPPLETESQPGLACSLKPKPKKPNSKAKSKAEVVKNQLLQKWLHLLIMMLQTLLLMLLHPAGVMSSQDISIAPRSRCPRMSAGLACTKKKRPVPSEVRRQDAVCLQTLQVNWLRRTQCV